MSYCPTLSPDGGSGCTLLSGHVGLCRNTSTKVRWCGMCGLPEGAHREDCPLKAQCKRVGAFSDKGAP